MVMYLIHLFTDRTARERPLIRRLAELDKKLFQVIIVDFIVVVIVTLAAL